jgi:carboxypeptidase family protein
MKSVAISLLLCVVLAPAALCSVEVVATQPSSQRPLITVMKDGVVQPGAQIVISAQNGKLKRTITSDSRGTVRLPRVRSGIYCIVASTSPTLRADLCLQIANSKTSTSSAFAMDLVVKPPPPPTLAEKLAAARVAPVTSTSRKFSGTVVDPSGTGIVRVSVVIYGQRAGDVRHVHTTLSDKQGRFSARLAPGKYTAVFSCPGFEAQLVTFEVARSAEELELDVNLKLGAST